MSGTTMTSSSRSALAQLQVAHPQHGGQSAPVPFQGTDMHGQAQRLLGLAFYIGTVLGYQRHQFTAKADI
jgi:hypothetical protein